MLVYDPKNRINFDELYNHQLFNFIRSLQKPDSDMSLNTPNTIN